MCSEANHFNVHFCQMVQYRDSCSFISDMNELDISKSLFAECLSFLADEAEVQSA